MRTRRDNTRIKLANSQSKADALNFSPDDRGPSGLLEAMDEPLPSVVIDCHAASVVAANSSGLDAIGLTAGDRLPAPLDSAMPAIAVLRELLARGLEQPAQHTLVFWRRSHTVTTVCNIALANPNQPTHVTIVFRPELEDTANLSAALNSSAAANDDSPPRNVRDDDETLKEIARRIRQSRRTDDGEKNVEPKITVPPPQNEQLGAAPESEVKNSEQPRRNHPMIGAAPTDSENVGTGLLIDDIAKLAHELKTPLTAIAAAAEIMRDERLGAMGNDKYLDYASDIHDSATHALAVIGEMLAVAPIDVKPANEAHAFDLTDLARRTVSALQPLAAHRQLTLAVDAEPALMPIKANATAVRQMLLNLLTNALKFTPAKGDVRVVTGYLDDGAIYFAVRDTGDGMSEEALAHAYGDGTEPLVARIGGGRGIGLRLVRRLAAENGAEFEIDSVLGKGTTVLVAFPKELVGGD